MSLHLLGGARVPIIGQPKIGDWAFTCHITCACGESLLLIGKPGQPGAGGAMAGCTKCTKAYALMGMPTITPDGAISIPLGVGEVQKKEEKPQP